MGGRSDDSNFWVQCAVAGWHCILFLFAYCFFCILCCKAMIVTPWTDSDLHTFRGIEPAGSGFIMGHEVTGEVIEVGDHVRSVQKGDVIVSAFTTSWLVLPCLSPFVSN